MIEILRVFLALDGVSLERAAALASLLGKRVRGFKIHDLLDREDKSVTALREHRARVWIDYKLHDTPDTVSRRSEALFNAGGGIISCHASGGVEMLRSAVALGAGRVYAITALTSLSDDDIREIYHCTREVAVKSLAMIAARADVHGIVCSPQEVAMLRAIPKLKDVALITPGIRMPGQSLDDQQSDGTPEQAIRDGADYIVVGRPITLARDPVAALDAIEKSIRKGLRQRATQ